MQKKYKKLNGLLASTADMALKRRAFTIINELDLKDNDKVLEVGCGAGYYMYLLVNLGIKLHLVGIDNNSKALSTAGRYLKGKKVKLVNADIMKKLPFRANSFDKVIISEVLEHLPKENIALNEIKRILKRDGLIVATVPNSNYPLLWDPINWVLDHVFETHISNGFWSGIWSQHLRLYKPREISFLFSKSSFKILKLQCLTFWCIPFNHYVLNFAARLLDQNAFNAKLANSVNKFKTSSKRPAYVKVAFWIFNTLDRLNDLYTPQQNGVSIFVKAKK